MSPGSNVLQRRFRQEPGRHRTHWPGNQSRTRTLAHADTNRTPLLGLARIHGNCIILPVTKLISYKRLGQVFPDWFAPKAQGWWASLLSDWFAVGVQFSGIWLDMNEVSSFCDGSWFAPFIRQPLIHDDERFTAVAPVQI